MKKVSFILFLAMGTQIMNAHPSVASHSHDSIISEWAWLIIPILALGIFGAYYTKKNRKKAS